MTTKKECTDTYTWNRTNLFDPATIKKSATITKAQKVKLLFRPNKWSLDEDETQRTITRYKKIGNVAFILDVKHYPKSKNDDGSKK